MKIHLAIAFLFLKGPVLGDAFLHSPSPGLHLTDIKALSPQPLLWSRHSWRNAHHHLPKNIFCLIFPSLLYPSNFCSHSLKLASLYNNALQKPFHLRGVCRDVFRDYLLGLQLWRHLQ